MDDLDHRLLDLFQSSDGLLLPDETALQEISIKQNALKGWNGEIVLRGLNIIREFLQDLASQNKGGLLDAIDELDWDSIEQPSTQPPRSELNSHSLFELTRHLSNWITVFIPPVRALDINSDKELVGCIESNDRCISALAAIMLGHEEFNYLGSAEKFRELLDTRWQTILRLELCQLLFTCYHDSQVLEKEIVPNLIVTDDQYRSIVMSEVLRKKLLSYFRGLLVWDIGTHGEGPRRRWALWWV